MSEQDQPAAEPTQPSTRKKWLTRLFHVVVLAVTLVFVGQNLAGAFSEFQQHKLDLHAGWLVAALVTYVASLTVLGLPMWLVLRNNNEPVTLFQSTRAYLISHVGKYVPGKAMAIVIRCTLLSPLGLSVPRVTITTFYETFAAMASGSVLAFVCLLTLPSSNDYAAAIAAEPWVLWLSLGAVMMGFVGAVTPMGFHLLTQAATLPFKTIQIFANERISEKTFTGSMLFGFVAWALMGFSYTATILAVSSSQPLTIQLWVISTACVSMSIVGGFLSMIPGQAVVREAILIQALTPVVGQLTAVVSSLLFRLITIVAELGVAAVLYLGGKR